MAVERRKIWKKGDFISLEDMMKIENKIATKGESIFILYTRENTEDNETYLHKTAQEIIDKADSDKLVLVKIVDDQRIEFLFLNSIVLPNEQSDRCIFIFKNSQGSVKFKANTLEDYPVLSR